jgi:preprotein translocase subunit SecD
MKFNYRIIIFAISIIFAIVYSVPSIFQTKWGPKVTLGLDLQGGLHLLLGVKTDEAVVSRVKSIASSVKHYTEHNEILVDSLGVTASTVEFTLLDHDDAKNISKLFADMKGVKVDIKGDSYTVSLTPEEIAKTKQQAVTQAIETIRNRLDQFGLSEPVVARQGQDNILVELPGIKTQAEEQRARELISRSAKLELMAVDEGRGARVSTLTPLDASNMGDEILLDAQMEGVKYLVHEIPILDGGMLTDARVEFDKNNRPVISFTLNSEGAQIFGDFTAKNVGNHLAIVLDGKVYSAPVINERIGGGSGQISGNYTMEGAQDLAIALRSGALLAPIYVMEKRSVGPSLGADSIHASLLALVSGFGLVVLFMIFYYGLA